jgi:hypothetical protein
LAIALLRGEVAVRFDGVVEVLVAEFGGVRYEDVAFTNGIGVLLLKRVP